MAAVGDEFQVNTYTNSTQWEPSVTDLADGGWLVAWASQKQNGFSNGVYAQRYDGIGNTVGAEFQVNTYLNTTYRGPSVTDLADGGWLVAWASDGLAAFESDRPYDSPHDVYAQRYDSGGNTVGGEFRVNTYTNLKQEDPSVTGLADGGWLVAWTSSEQDGSYHGVYAQRYDISGNTVGAEFQVNGYTHDRQNSPVVTALADGGWLVAWESWQEGPDYEVNVRRYDSSGNAEGDEFRVNTYTHAEQHAPSVTALADGGWLVVWGSWQEGQNHEIYAQRYDGSGNALGEEFRVNTYTDNNQDDPVVTALADGGWLVVWRSGEQDGSSFGVYAQRYDGSGNTVGDEFQVNSYTDDFQYAPSVTALADGGWLVTWQSEGQDGSSLGVYAKRYDSDGNSSNVRSDVFVASYLPSQYTFIDGVLSGDEGDNALNDIEYIGFGYGFGSDALKVDVVLDDLIDPDGAGELKSHVATTLDTLSDLYIAYFGRAPDAEGLTYWFRELYTGSLDFQSTAKSFSDQAEFQSTYPEDSSNREFIESVYANMFNRTPDDAGWDYWEGELDGGMAKDVFLLAVINGAYSPTGGADDAALLENKHDVSMYYAEQTMLNPQEGFDEGISELLALVTSDVATVEAAENVIDYAFSDPLTLTGVLEDQALVDSLWVV